MTELERCIAMLRRDRPAGRGPQVPFRFGTRYLHDELPNVWSRNYLSLEQDLEDATAELVAAEADRVLGEAGVAHRKVEVLRRRGRRAAGSGVRGARVAGRVRRGHGRRASARSRS